MHSAWVPKITNYLSKGFYQRRTPARNVNITSISPIILFLTIQMQMQAFDPYNQARPGNRPALIPPTHPTFKLFKPFKPFKLFKPSNFSNPQTLQPSNSPTLQTPQTP